MEKKFARLKYKSLVMKLCMKQLFQEPKSILNVPSLCQCPEFDKRSRPSSDDSIIILSSVSPL
jgi:hypothetical protein